MSKLTTSDLGLNDIVEQTGKVPEEELQVEIEIVEEGERPYEDVLKSLTEYTKRDETFILVPIKDMDGNTIRHSAVEIGAATADEFACWATTYCPPLISYKDKLHLFKTRKERLGFFNTVIDYHKNSAKRWAEASRANRLANW